MYQRAKDYLGRSLRNYLRRFGEQCDSVVCQRQTRQSRSLAWWNLERNRRASYVARLLLIALLTQPLLAQAQSAGQSQTINPNIPRSIQTQQRTSGSQAKRPITISDAVSIFLQQNLQLVASRYDIDSVDAEKLTARLRPNPEISVGVSDIPLSFRDSFLQPQTFSYDVSQTFELGGKRRKRIDVANANSAVAQAEFQIVVWQLTNDLKKKFYAVLLAQSLLKLAQENEQTFAEIIKHTSEVFKLGEISGLDLQRLEVEKFKFDTDVANSEKDYEIALRDLRLALGGDYRSMDIEVAGAIDYYQPYEFSLPDLRDKALAARPDLKAAQLSERAADASIRLQDAQRIPDVTVGAGVEQVPQSGSTYNASVGIPLPVHDRNQGERAKALIEKKKAQNQQQIISNQVLSDVDKALVAFEIQKRRVELYRTGVLTKVDDIQRLTEFSLQAGESSTLELLDAIRTRRETLAGFYQTLFDYQASLLDLELATATPLQK
ncbi:MAG TPA: TolC family protein [Pyrinomonadaceae bacterium]|nr:TolC family protein [Pyrinomonadaceae bacterium]